MKTKQSNDSVVSAEDITSHSGYARLAAVPIEEPYFDKNGREIKEFAVIKVYHYSTGRKRKKHHFMYKWVRLVESNGKKYWYGQHLTDATGFFEKGSNKKLSGYYLKGGCDENRKLLDTEIVQQHD